MRSRLILSALLAVTLLGCATDGGAASTADGGSAAPPDAEATSEPGAALDCPTSLEVTTPAGEMFTLTSANIQWTYGDRVFTVFAADFAIEDHEVAGRPPDFPTAEGNLVWIDVGDPREESDPLPLDSGTTVTLPGSGSMIVAASLITAHRMDPLFGEQTGSIEFLQLTDEACLAIDVTVDGVQIRGTATGPILHGD